MKLPARLFRWRGYANGPEVATFRIAKGYCTPDGKLEEHVEAALTDLPFGVDHTMCFVGVGDHGGGPTEEMIEWVRSHRESFPGTRLAFSSPDNFFRATRPSLARLPLVVGELQMHAVGCYSVHRPVKVSLRNAEHRLAQAETVLKGRKSSVEDRRQLDIAWKRVCFHHFHDTLGGTCLPTAYVEVQAQLGQALAIADEVSALTLRREIISLPSSPHQRLIFFNASELPYDDYVEVEPWLEWTKWDKAWEIIDETGRAVRYQVMEAESAGGLETRLLFRIKAEPSVMRTFRIVRGTGRKPGRLSGFTCTANSFHAKGGPSVQLGNAGSMSLPGLRQLPLPELTLCEDHTDTWSHGIDRYERKNVSEVTWESPFLQDEGPLMASLIQKGRMGQSRVQAEWRLHDGCSWIDLRLRVLWNEERRLLKLDWSFPEAILHREDGILGGSLVRSTDGRELPLRDWTLLRWKKGGMAVITPDVFACDCTSTRLGLTLLRGCVLACHEPNPGTHARAVYSDRGEHAFRFRFLAAGKITAAELDALAFAQQRPLLSATSTRGMPTRALRAHFHPLPAK